MDSLGLLRKKALVFLELELFPLPEGADGDLAPMRLPVVPTDCLETADGFVSIDHLLTTDTGVELAVLPLLVVVVALLVVAPATLGLLEAVLGGGRDGGTPGPFLCDSGVRLPPVEGEDVLEEDAVGAFGDFRPAGELDGLLIAFLAVVEVDEFMDALVEAGRSCGLVFRTTVVL